MEINVAQLLKQPVGANRKYTISEYADLGDGDLSLTKGEVTLLRTDRGILAQGLLEGKIKAVCSRCLGMFDYPIGLKIQEEFFPTLDPIRGVRLSPPETADDLIIDENHILDLAETVRQQGVIAMPLKPLCRPDCAGLCPSCGQDLNQGPCSCPSEGQKEIISNATLT
ncbi:MAG: DUF177 domain-containing protein [Dehalococcoidia bacterium]